MFQMAFELKSLRSTTDEVVKGLEYMSIALLGA